MIRGINMIIPPEMLHKVGVGIAVYVIGVIKEFLDDTTQTELDFSFIDIYYELKLNCNHDYCEKSLHKGATANVK